MEEINRLDDKFEKRMDKFEDGMEELRNEFHEHKLTLQESTILTKHCIKSMEKFSELVENSNATTMEMSYVLKEMEKSIADSNRRNEEKFTENDERLVELKKEVECQDEKTKFDFALFIKNNFATICLTIFVVLDKVGVL